MRADVDEGFALPLALIGALAVLLSASSIKGCSGPGEKRSAKVPLAVCG